MDNALGVEGAPATGNRQPDWRLCLSWVVLVTAISLAGGAALACWYFLQDVIADPTIHSTLFFAGPLLINVGVTLAMAMLQARLLSSRGVKPVLWVVASITAAVASAFLLLPWLEFLYDAFDVWNSTPGLPGREWLVIVGPILQSLPGAIVCAILQGLVLARGGPKSRVGWWVLACAAGQLIGSGAAQIAQILSQVAVYIASANLPVHLPGSSSISASLLASTFVGGTILALAQGVTLALMFKGSTLHTYPPAAGHRGELLAARAG